jgi:phosphoribosyl 1,2-cyclic phosphodiesterase
MSTFKGIVSGKKYISESHRNYSDLSKEFPEIRIDYFRGNSDQTPPLACFLSHVHSDHLQGLESLKAPFVYCSPATREVIDDPSFLSAMIILHSSFMFAPRLMKSDFTKFQTLPF